jgi:hypothetical protein
MSEAIVYVKTPSGLIVPMLADENGNIYNDLHGYIGGAWKKNPIVFGYSRAVLEKVYNVNLPAGTSTIDTTTVPAGQVHIYTNIGVQYVGTVASVVLHVGIHTGALVVNIFNTIAIGIIVADAVYERQGMFVIPAGHYVRLTIVGATLNDDAYLNVAGYAMDVNL